MEVLKSSRGSRQGQSCPHTWAGGALATPWLNEHRLQGPGPAPMSQDRAAEGLNSPSLQGQGPNESPHGWATENPREDRPKAAAVPRSPQAGFQAPQSRGPRTPPECSNRLGGAPHTRVWAEQAGAPSPRPSLLTPRGPRTAPSPRPVFNVLKPRDALLPPAPSAAPTGQRPHTWLATKVVSLTSDDRCSSLPAPPGTEGSRRWQATWPPPVSSFPASSHLAPTGALQTLTSPPQPLGRSPHPDTHGEPNTRDDGPEETGSPPK